MRNDRSFTTEQIVRLLNETYGKTLGEVDSKNIFAKAIKKPKITGIAGDVIEQSVLGLMPDTKQEPDLLIDGELIELKTTGIRINKRTQEFDAKEPMSITAVSIENITHESFYTSHFWNKVKKTLLVYYHYNSYTPVTALEYSNFCIIGYEFHEFSNKDIEVLKQDWETVRDFIRFINENFDIPENEYHRLSNELRPKLSYIDTAPKWPHPPRFRLKRSTVSSIVHNFFSKKKLEKVEIPVNWQQYLHQKCSEFTKKYKGKTIEELVKILGIKLSKDKNGKEIYDKAIGEKIIVRMFGSKSNKLNQIEFFRKIGLIGKTVTLSQKDSRTEDMKMFRINLDEFEDYSIIFENSSVRDFFAENHFLFIIFKETDKSGTLKKNKFEGFKKYSFTDEFIYHDIRNTWEQIRELILNNKLKENIVYYKGTRKAILNPSGTVKTELNFPKSSENILFVRGSGDDSTKKPICLQGIKMYHQYYWIKGEWIVDILNNIKYL